MMKNGNVSGKQGATRIKILDDISNVCSVTDHGISDFLLEDQAMSRNPVTFNGSLDQQISTTGHRPFVRQVMAP
jgi:hypothetical protein